MKKAFFVLLLVIPLLSSAASEPVRKVRIVRTSVPPSVKITPLPPVQNPQFTTSTPGSSRLRALKAFPAFYREALPVKSLANGENVLYRFKVTSFLGTAGITQFTPKIVPVNLTVKNINIYAFTDPAYKIPLAGVSAGGKLRSSNVLTLDANNRAEINVTTETGGVNALQIPQSQTRYFEVRANLSNVGTTSSVTTTILGDARAPIVDKGLDTAAGIRAGAEHNLIWSPNTNGISSTRTKDWTNGAEVGGLSGIGAEVLPR